MFKTETYLSNGNTLEYLKLNDIAYVYNILDEDYNSIQTGFCEKKEILELEKGNNIKNNKDKYFFVKKDGMQKLLYDPCFSRFDLHPTLLYTPNDFINADNELPLLLNCVFLIKKGKHKELFELKNTCPLPESIFFSSAEGLINNEIYDLNKIIEKYSQKKEIKFVPDHITGEIIRSNKSGKNCLEFFYKPNKSQWEYIYKNFLLEKKLQVHESMEAKKYILDKILGFPKI